MTTFLQLHLLTSYPPACLNRDDLNRPKTAVMGGVPRLRISSQSLKRAWRTSDLFTEQLTGQTGVFSKELGRKIKDALLSGTDLDKLLGKKAPKAEPDNKLTDSQASEWAKIIASEFVNKKSKGSDDNDDEADSQEGIKKKSVKSNVKDTLKSEQMVFYSIEEIKEIDKLIQELRLKQKTPSQEQLSKILVKNAGGTADLALFGRMLASSPEFNVEAACQVAHALSVHKVAIEDDFFTAVDDLNKHEVDAGSAHMGEQSFAAGLFYLYLCIDCSSLSEKLGNELANKTIAALTEAVATVAPSGKQNSFGSRASASYILAEKGSRQPRSLSVAFLEPIKGEKMLSDAIKELEKTRNNMDGVYYGWDKELEKDGEKIKVAKCLPSYVVNATKGQGNFQELIEFVGNVGGA